MEHKNLNTEETANSDLGAVMRSPYPEKDIRTLWWDVALSIGENPEKFIQDNINAQNEKFDAKKHWRDVFGTEPPTETKQTAVEWLEQELKKIPFVNVKEVFEQAKEMEKEQIVRAFGYEEIDGEQYYNETYNK